MLSKIEEKIIAYVKKYDKISLFFHAHPDMDALCSCFAFKEFVSNLYPNKKINICRFNNLKDDITRGLFPKLKNKPQHFLSESLGIIFDTANAERVAGQEYIKCKEVIRIDHHPKIESFGKVELVDSSAAACCQILAKLFFNWNDKAVNKSVAEYLYIGILTDTNRFFYPSTSSETLSIAAKLLTRGIDRDKINNTLYLNPLNVIRFNNYVFRLAKFINKNKIGYIILPKGIFEEYGVPPTTPIVHILGGIKELEIWSVLYYEEEMKVWKGSIRSRSVPINDIAEKYNGGGHKLAAGFKLKNKNDFSKVIKDIEKKILKK